MLKTDRLLLRGSGFVINQGPNVLPNSRTQVSYPEPNFHTSSQAKLLLDVLDTIPMSARIWGTE